MRNGLSRGGVGNNSYGRAHSTRARGVMILVIPCHQFRPHRDISTRGVPAVANNGAMTMGVDLRLLPFDADSSISFSHTILDCDRDYPMFDAIQELGALPAPKTFTSFSGRCDKCHSICYGQTLEDPYGSPVLYVTASLLVSVKHDQMSQKNRAIWAYLEHLAPSTKIALYWH